MPDHRRAHAWLTCFLGDPFAACWFIAENPSLGQVERAAVRELPEPMWCVSPGDLVFRRMLVEHRFKTGTVTSKGGWRCYITDVIKSVARAEQWKGRRAAEGLPLAEVWAPVLRWELEHGKPRLIVALGKDSERLLLELESRKLIPTLPPLIQIHHYAYIASRADAARRLGPMNPVRLAEYSADFAKIARRLANAH